MTQVAIAQNGEARRGRRSLTVGLVNNMPDGALRTTESQFRSLLRAARPDGVDLTLRLLQLPGVERGAAARAALARRYQSVENISRADIDALIVTGTEPRAERLEHEPYWPGLARLVDWSAANGVPTVWSCLAAHAAVWRLSGVCRSRLPVKHSGVFALRASGPHPLLEGAPAQIAAPHSRLNDLSAARLEDAGYRVLTRSDFVGVDAFVRPDSPGSLFLQGHPEYDARALAREYLRDVSRYLRGLHPSLPRPPADYFDGAVLRQLERLERASAPTSAPERLDEYARVIAAASPRALWRPWAVHVYRAWLEGAIGRNAVWSERASATI